MINWVVSINLVILFYVLSENVFVLGVFFSGGNFLVKMWMFARVELSIYSHHLPHQLSSVLAPAINLWNLWHILLGFAHESYRKSSLKWHLSKVNLDHHRLFQIGRFQALNRWRLDSLGAQTFSLSVDELASHVLAVFSCFQRELFFAEATSQPTAPRANLLMLMATPL